MENFIVPIKPIVLSSEKSEISAQPVAGQPFQDVLKQVLGDLREATEVSEQNGTDLALGRIDNLAQFQIDSMKKQAMMQTTVQLTTRMVNAYKEIMQMSV